MRRPFCGDRRPPWWPHDEPWPARTPQQRAGRARFFRRAAGLAILVLLLSVWGAVSLARLAATTLRIAAASEQRTVALLVAGGMGGLAFALVALVGMLR